MNGYNNYIAAVVALLSATTVSGRGTDAVHQTASTTPASATPAPVEIEITTGDDTNDVELPDVFGPQARPHLLGDDEVAKLLVRTSGGVCSGTPITGTNHVVTAAHCVLTDSGEVTQRTVVRDGHRYPAVAVLVDTEYAEHATAENDAAVLILAEQLPGPSVRIGTVLPDSGDLTLAGYQPLESDGSLNRNKDVITNPRPKGATGNVKVTYEPAACVTPASALDVTPAHVMVPCGLVPGASGGGFYAKVNGEYVLVGILSSVTTDLTTNGVVPLASLQKLLAHPEQFTHGFSSDSNDSPRHDRIERS